MDLISSNSGNTFNKAINNYYNIYTEYKNDSILVNFGDSNSKVYQLNSGIKFKFIVGEDIFLGMLYCGIRT